MMSHLWWIALLCFCGVSFTLDLKSPAINPELIDIINTNPNSTWVAGVNGRLKGWTIGDFSKLLGVQNKVPTSTLPKKHFVDAPTLPLSFDSRTTWPGCIGPVLDQGHCGSCWAFGAVESLEDRLCIQSRGTINVSLSEQMLVSCDPNDGGCGGGDLVSAWNFLSLNGTVTTQCYPYDMGTCQHPGCSEWPTPSCNHTCQNGNKFSQFYYAQSVYTITTVPDIQTEILTNGPVEVSFAVYEDFANYKSGVYVHKTGNLLGYHAVKNIGWGVDSSGVNYWIIQNSWNTDWGMNGFFYIRRGTDECGIEDNVVAGLAKIKM